MKRTSLDVKAELLNLKNTQSAILDKYPDGDMPEALAAEVREADGKIETLLAEYSAREQEEGRAKSNQESMARIFAPRDQPQPTHDGSHKAQGPDTRSLGERFVSDPEFKSWHQSITHGSDKISGNVSVLSPVVAFNNVPAIGASLVTGLSSTSAGALVIADRLPGITPLERDEITILNLITRIPITSDAFEFVRVTSETLNAAPVAEATSTADGAKPESTAALAVVSGVIETIAHIVNITRRAAADAGQIMAYINDLLSYGLMDELANQVLNGSGTTPNLAGLANTSNTQSQAWDTDILTTTRKARTLVRTVGKATPTAYLMNPADWETIDLLQDNEARYFFGGPSRLGTPVLWGVPVVEEERQAAGTAWVGDFRELLLFDRQQATIYMTDSNKDYFERNILSLLAELRAGAGVRRPKAFVEIDMASA